MSSTTTSQFSFQTRSSASCALRASPNTAPLELIGENLLQPVAHDGVVVG